jgi:hypothetical protein
MMACLLATAGASAADLQVQAGVARFIEGPTHFLIGGAYRHPLSRRWSVQPEVQYLYGSRNDHDFVLGGNVVVDLRAGGRPVTPYLLAGGGLVHTSLYGSRFSEPLVQGGVGVRIALDGGWYAAPELRFGKEVILRLQFGIGYRFGRR